MKKLIAFICLLIIANSSFADITLPQFFTDHMVLQRNQPIALWGWAKPGETITVHLHGQQKQAIANKKGKWSMSLDAEKEGGPYSIEFSGENMIRLNDILIGDVWLCSGQSNMEWTVAQSANAVEEMANARYPMIRHIKINRSTHSLPQDDAAASGWKECSPTQAGSFSAVGYFFARSMYEKLNVPQGIINASWGGTNIETWISRQGFESSEVFSDMIKTMPQINTDSLIKLRNQHMLLQLQQIQGKRTPDMNSAYFTAPTTNDKDWPQINQPQGWEDQVLGNIDGAVWVRKNITLTKAQANAANTLFLSKIDDEDSTFVNGTLIGVTTIWDKPRMYQVPPGLLKEGNNCISIRIHDTGGGGGIWGNPADLKLRIGSLDISLAGPWKCFVEKPMLASIENAYPSLLYNAMIHPLLPFSIKGILWYQGESNVPRAFEYRHTFPLLIADWRDKWQQPWVPFYFVQLATFNNPGNSNEGCAWAELREAQSMALTVPHTGMCVTTDIGAPEDIHPANKQEVGKRLAALALNDLFGYSSYCKSPSFHQLSIQGNTATIVVKHEGKGLVVTGKSKRIAGFEIAGEDHRFYPATAEIKEKNRILVTAKEVPHPVAVHYAWKGNASDCNVASADGLPLAPFRTDEWITVTRDERYSISLVE